MDAKLKNRINEEFRSFWVPILYDQETGILNVEQLKMELHDYFMLMKHVPKVYMAITGGKISKANTDSGVVISVFEDYMTDCLEEAMKDNGLVKLVNPYP